MKIDCSDSSKNIISQSYEGKRVFRKKPWTAEEDRNLVYLITKFGPHKWSHIANLSTDRVGKQCRERWHNHLSPHIKKECWQKSEEWILFICHQLMGNKWSDISKHLPGRADNSLKNNWNSIMRKNMPNMKLKLTMAIELYKKFPLKFSKKYPPFEQNIIKQIIDKNCLNKDWDIINENDDSSDLRIKNISFGDGTFNLSLELFENVDRLDQLIEAVKNKTLSTKEVASVLDFLDTFEDILLEKRSQMKTYCLDDVEAEKNNVSKITRNIGVKFYEAVNPKSNSFTTNEKKYCDEITEPVNKGHISLTRLPIESVNSNQADFPFTGDTNVSIKTGLTSPTKDIFLNRSVFCDQMKVMKAEDNQTERVFGQRIASSF